VTVTNNGADKFVYLLRFLLSETGGQSGATIQSIETTVLDEKSDTGQSCWREILRVPPAGTLDTFDTDAGDKMLSYCSPDAGSRTEASRVFLTLTFTDDDGRSSTVETSTSVTR
jgi:hypothetical protein